MEKEETSGPRRRLSCTTHFDALWFCSSPVHQMQQYYRLGGLDNCSEKWSALVDCLSLKTKKSSKVEVSMFNTVGNYRDSGKSQASHMVFRSPEDAASHWKELFGKLDGQE